MTTRGARTEFKGNERFVVESTLGQGGMGIVYRARDLQRGSVVALKTMTHLYPAALLRFKKEFRALADIAHPSVVQLYDLFAEGEQWFFTMELLEGTHFVRHVRVTEWHPSTGLTVTEVNAISHLPTRHTHRTNISSVRPDGTRTSPLARPNSGALVGNERRLRAALLRLLDGVLAIHASGRLHRDIKPSNVMVTPEGRVVLLDFGVVGDLAEDQERPEDSGVGTPAYMAPEQARGLRVTPAADFYAVGVMLYEALTGQLPFVGTFLELFQAKQAGQARRPSEVVKGVPADLEALCLELLAPDPQARPDGGEIMARLRAGQPQPRAITRSTSVAGMPSSAVAFVGREVELAVLRRGVEHVAAREGVLTLVSGASGIGKTTLIQRFLKEAGQAPRALVLSGRCYEREAVPFKGLDSLVDELSRWLLLVPAQELARLLPANAAELLRVFPVLRGVAALEEQSWLWPEVKEPQELRRRAFMALRSLLVAIAKERPLILHIDDLHWTDVDSVALLEQVLHAPGAPAMLLVGSFRSEALGKSPALGALLAMAERLSSKARVERIELTRLTYEDSARLAALSLGDQADSSPDAVKRIAEESQGLPLFVSELSTWQRTLAPAEASRLISLDAVIQGRVDQLPTEGQALLEVLCIAGGPLPTQVAEYVAGVSDADTLHARLRVAKLTRTVASGERELVDIYHGRIRDSLIGRIGGQRQRALHWRLATALEGTGNADEGVLLEQFLAAGDDDGARRHVLPAAVAAEGGLAFLRAAGLYRQAIELRVAHPVWLLKRCEADALLSAGHAAEAAAAYASAVHHAPLGERTTLRRKAAEHFLKTGAETEGLRLLREALDDVKLGYPETGTSALESLSSSRTRLRLRGLDFEARESLLPDERERIDVAFAASSGLADVDVIRAADFGARHLILALDGGEPVRICRALAIEASGRAAVDAQGPDEVAGLVRAAERLAMLSGDSYAVALAKLAAGFVHLFSGEWRAAHTTLDEAEQTMRERCRGVHWELANAVAWSMNALVQCGELRAAAQRVPEAVREAQERADRFALMHLIYPTAMTAIVADDPDSALRVARDFANTGSAHSNRFTGGHWGSLMSRVSANRYRAQGLLAHREMEIDYVRLKGAHLLRVHLVRVCTTFERGLCALSAVEDGGDRLELLRLATSCAHELLEDGPGYAAPMGRYLFACLHALNGEREQALEQLDLAIAGLSRFDMGYLANCAKARRGALGGGDAGRELFQASSDWLREQGVVNVARCLDMSAPGFSRNLIYIPTS